MKAPRMPSPGPRPRPIFAPRLEPLGYGVATTADESAEASQEQSGKNLPAGEIHTLVESHAIPRKGSNHEMFEFNSSSQNAPYSSSVDSAKIHMSQTTIQKPDLAMFNGPRRLTMDSKILQTGNTVRVRLSNGRSYVTDIDPMTTRRAEAFCSAGDPGNMLPRMLEMSSYWAREDTTPLNHSKTVQDEVYDAAQSSNEGRNLSGYKFHQDHRFLDSYPLEYSRDSTAGSPAITYRHSAPRRRSALACQFCRRRKLRCSGYLNSPGGKCTNCIRINGECVFEPVSSTYPTPLFAYGTGDGSFRSSVQEKKERGSHNVRKPDYEPTDSGYASIPNPQQLSNNRNDVDPPKDSSTPPLPLNADGLSDMNTVFSTTTFTIPEVTQDSIRHICEDIYNKIRLGTNASKYSHLITTIPELIKAFALRLGSCSSHGMSRKIMCFVYKHHNEISSILAERLGGNEDHEPEKSFSDKGAMSLVDKMSLWVKDHREIQACENDTMDYFEGVEDIENDEPLSTPELSIYSQAILDSSAYQWLLDRMKTRLELQWGSTGNAIDDIRLKILRTLRPGKICRSEPPKTFTTTFTFPRNLLQSLKENAETTNIFQQGLSLANLRVLVTTGGADLQLSIISDYTYQVWPEFGTKLLDGFQWLLDEIDGNSGKKYSAKFFYGDGIELSYDGVTAYANVCGPAYMISQCAEQLAWLEAVLRSCYESRHCYTPSLVKIDELKFGVHALPEVLIDSSAVPWSMAQENSSNDLSFSTFVNGYPTARRPEGFSGVEMPGGFPHLSSKMLRAHDGNVILYAGSLVCSFVKRESNVWLWHVADQIDSTCICRRSSISEGMTDEIDQRLIDIASHHRHIIGDCGGYVKKDEVSSFEDHLGRLTMPHANKYGLVEDDKSLTGYCSLSQSVDSDLLSFSSFSEVGERASVAMDGSTVIIINNTVARLLTEHNTGMTPIQLAELNDGGSSNRPQSGSSRIPQSCHTSNNQSASRSSQKRKLDQRDKDDQEDDFPGKERPKKTRHEADSERKLFACPFWKFNSTKYHACFQLKLLTSSRVKQHLSRNHTPRFYCQVCYLLFADDKMQEAHVIQRACNRESGAKLDGILPDQQYQLSRKPKSALTEKEKWFRIWEIVFPDEQPPLSPYIDSKLADCCARFREHWQNRGAEILSAEIRDSGIFPAEAVDEDKRQQLLREILARGLDMIWESWNARTTIGNNESISTSRTSELSAPVLSRHPNPTVFMDSTTSTSSFVDSALGNRGNITSTSLTSDAYSDTALFGSYTETSIAQYHDLNDEAPPINYTQDFQQTPLWADEFPDFQTICPFQIDHSIPES